VQVIAEVETTPADSFALLLRYPPGDWRKVGGDPIDFGGEPPRFQSLHEGVDTDVSGTTAGSDCEAPALDGTYPLTAVAGDPLFQYGAVIDRHVPLEVGYRDGTLLMVHGGPDVDGRPTVADAVDADDERWATLLTQPN
jgi:hypothetical protein